MEVVGPVLNEMVDGRHHGDQGSRVSWESHNFFWLASSLVPS